MRRARFPPCRRRADRRQFKGSTGPSFARLPPRRGGHRSARRGSMSTLVAIGYGDPYKAEEVRLMLRKMKRDYLIDLDDAVVAVKDEKGKIKLNQPLT